MSWFAHEKSFYSQFRGETRQKRKERRGLHQPMPISGRYSIYKRMEPRKHDSVDWHHRNLGSSRRTSTTLFTLFPIREYIKWKIAQYIIWLRRSLTNYSNNSRKERTLSLFHIVIVTVSYSRVELKSIIRGSMLGRSGLAEARGCIVYKITAAFRSDLSWLEISYCFFGMVHIDSIAETSWLDSYRNFV